MTPRRERQRPGWTGRTSKQTHWPHDTTARTRGRPAAFTAIRGTLPADWRARLPDPERYFREHVENLGRANATGWAQGRCPLHDDHNASLSVQLCDVRGGWRCFAGCGSGDLIGFHQRRTGLGFVEAVRDLLAGGAA